MAEISWRYLGAARHEQAAPRQYDPAGGRPGALYPRHRRGSRVANHILPRTSYCLRPPVANIDLLCLTVVLTPQPDWLLGGQGVAVRAHAAHHPAAGGQQVRFERGRLSGCTAYVRKGQFARAARQRPNRAGLDTLHQAMQGHLCCFAGQSGVGKSRLISELLGIELVSQSISERSSAVNRPPGTLSC